MNKNINNIVELTEKELACVCGGISGTEIDNVERSMRRRGKSKEDIEAFTQRMKALGCT